MSIRDKNREVDMPGKLARLALLLCAALLCSQTVRAQSWNATAGAQSQGKGRQALAFLPTKSGFTPETASPGLSVPMSPIA